MDKYITIENVSTCHNKHFCMEAVCTDVDNAILLVQKINFEETFHFCKKKKQQMFNRIYAWYSTKISSNVVSSEFRECLIMWIFEVAC